MSTREQRAQWLAIGVLKAIAHAVKEKPADDTLLWAEALTLAAEALLDQKARARQPGALH